jgi:hypothetical protein
MDLQYNTFRMRVRPSALELCTYDKEPSKLLFFAPTCFTYAEFPVMSLRVRLS